MTIKKQTLAVAKSTEYSAMMSQNFTDFMMLQSTGMSVAQNDRPTGEAMARATEAATALNAAECAVRVARDAYVAAYRAAIA